MGAGSGLRRLRFWLHHSSDLLPALARSLVADPLVFGWAWPFFGVAAAASTVLVTRRFSKLPARTVCVWSLVIMVAGVLAPALSSSVAAIVVSALCVGATFVVVTLVGFQDARRNAQGPPTRLMAAMTAAFAVGQLLGPPFVAFASTQGNAILVPSLAATATLLACALTLAVGAGALTSRAS